MCDAYFWKLHNRSTLTSTLPPPHTKMPHTSIPLTIINILFPTIALLQFLCSLPSGNEEYIAFSFFSSVWLVALLPLTFTSMQEQSVPWTERCVAFFMRRRCTVYLVCVAWLCWLRGMSCNNGMGRKKNSHGSFLWLMVFWSAGRIPETTFNYREGNVYGTIKITDCWGAKSDIEVELARPNTSFSWEVPTEDLVILHSLPQHTEFRVVFRCENSKVVRISDTWYLHREGGITRDVLFLLRHKFF